MKKAYLLSFSDDFGTREQVKNCLGSMSSIITWRYDMTNAFYIISESSAEIISDQLRNLMNSGGRYIVTEISENSQGWLTEGSWYLMQNKEQMPEKK